MTMLKTPIILGLFMLVSLATFAQDKSEMKEEVLYTAEKMPEYPGGIEAIYKLIGGNLLYPDTTLETAKEGRVVLRFVISSTGDVTDISVLKGLSKACDEEAIRVMKLVPKWIPAQQDGKNVAVYNTLPIYFKRQNPALLVDGVVKPYGFLKDSILTRQKDIISMTILKEETAKTIYGDIGKNGIILVAMKPMPMVDNVTHKELKSGEVAYGVEVMPQFPGGDEELMKFIHDNLKLPASAAEAGIQGRVTLRFTVTTTGEVTDVKVIRSLDPACDAEAIRVIRKMPNWIPGSQNGKNVPVYYTFPIIFKY